jgi:hypothetical protein
VPRLIVQRADAVEQWVPLDEHALRIGRAPENTLILEDEGKAVSRFHAEVRWDGQRFTLVDLGSQNGTWVNGARVTSHVLSLDEPIVIGPYQLLLAEDDRYAPGGHGSGTYRTSPRGDRSETPSVSGFSGDVSSGAMPLPASARPARAPVHELWRDWRVLVPLTVLLLVGVVSVSMVVTSAPPPPVKVVPPPPPPPPPPPGGDRGGTDGVDKVPGEPTPDEIARFDTLIDQRKCDEAKLVADDHRTRYPDSQRAQDDVTRAAECRPRAEGGQRIRDVRSWLPPRPRETNGSYEARANQAGALAGELERATSEGDLVRAEQKAAELRAVAELHPALEASQPRIAALRRDRSTAQLVGEVQAAAQRNDLLGARDALNRLEDMNPRAAQQELETLRPRFAEEGERQFKIGRSRYTLNGVTGAVKEAYGIAQKLLPRDDPRQDLMRAQLATERPR